MYPPGSTGTSVSRAGSEVLAVLHVWRALGWIRRGLARVSTFLEEWADRDTRVALVRVRTGGRR